MKISVFPQHPQRHEESPLWGAVTESSPLKVQAAAANVQRSADNEAPDALGGIGAGSQEQLLELRQPHPPSQAPDH